jgi:putative membrane protein
VLRYLPLVLTTAALGLHLLGERLAAIITGRPRSAAARIRALYFYAALLTIFVALAGPIDSLAEKLFWVHMVQHVLLLTVAPPLIVLSAPWMSIWRPLPLGLRRSVARTVARSPRLGWLRATCRWLSRPTGAWLAFSVNLIGWHIPPAYDLAIRSTAVHALEHITYLAFGVLLWLQVLDSPPMRVRLDSLKRVYYMTAAMLVGWGLSIVLALAPNPLYPIYAHLASRPGGISALTDQQLAAGVMLVPGSITMTLYIFIQLYRWLGVSDDPEPTRQRRAAPAGVGGVGGAP